LSYVTFSICTSRRLAANPERMFPIYIVHDSSCNSKWRRKILPQESGKLNRHRFGDIGYNDRERAGSYRLRASGGYDMAPQVLEGTWDEIRAHEREFAGQRLRVQVIPERPVAKTADVPVIFDPSSEPMLTDEVREVLDSFIALLQADIRAYVVPASKIEVWGMELPDDGTEGISVHLTMSCDTDEEAWGYFKDFLTRAEGWMKALAPAQETIFWSKISFDTWRMRNE
jgi:hypothetical protein